MEVLQNAIDIFLQAASLDTTTNATDSPCYGTFSPQDLEWGTSKHLIVVSY